MDKQLMKQLKGESLKITRWKMTATDLIIIAVFAGLIWAGVLSIKWIALILVFFIYAIQKHETKMVYRRKRE